MHDWDHIRVFLAAARAGSLNAAARTLGTSQPTVGRRLAILETELGAPLFDRHQDGLSLTEAGRTLLPGAAAMEEAAFAFERAHAATSDSMAGTVAIAATDGLGILWLTPRLGALGLAHPRLTIEVMIDNGPADLMRREADIAIRLARPITPDLVARRAGSLAYRLFAGADYLERHGTPASVADLARHRFVTLALTQAAPDPLLHDLVEAGAGIAYRGNSALAQAAATRAGLGLAVLPAYLGGLFPDLIPVLPAIAWQPRDIWLVAHPELKRSQRVRVVFDAVLAMFRDSVFHPVRPSADA